MIIQYASDLHLEFKENAEYIRNNPLAVTGDILVLAGDTIYFGTKIHEADWFFDWCSENFEQTYLIPGNHEYYGGFPMEHTLEGFELKLRNNVTYLNNKSVILGDSELFFTTFWTRIPSEEWYVIEKIMSDCRYGRIDGKRFNCKDWNRLHHICVEWLTQSLASSTAAHKIVISHHCPHTDDRGVLYVGKMAASAYMSDMLPLMDGYDIEYWIHGHLHMRKERSVNGIKILSNPLGYVDDGENIGFESNAMITF